MQIILYIIGANNLVKWLILITNFQLTVVQIMKSVYKFGIEQHLAGGRTWRLDVATFRLITVADCPPYAAVSHRRPSLSSRRISRHVYTVTACLSPSPQEASLQAPLYPGLHQDPTIPLTAPGPLSCLRSYTVMSETSAVFLCLLCICTSRIHHHHHHHDIIHEYHGDTSLKQNFRAVHCSTWRFRGKAAGSETRWQWWALTTF